MCTCHFIRLYKIFAFVYDNWNSTWGTVPLSIGSLQPFLTISAWKAHVVPRKLPIRPSHYIRWYDNLRTSDVDRTSCSIFIWSSVTVCLTVTVKRTSIDRFCLYSINRKNDRILCRHRIFQIQHQRSTWGIWGARKAVHFNNVEYIPSHHDGTIPSSRNP